MPLAWEGACCPDCSLEGRRRSDVHVRSRPSTPCKLVKFASHAGISSYSSLPGKYKLSQLQGAMWQYDQELSMWGVDIKDLMWNKQKPFILSEYGAWDGGGWNGKAVNNIPT